MYMIWTMDILTYGLFSEFNGCLWGYTALGSGRKKSLTKDSDTHTVFLKVLFKLKFLECEMFGASKATLWLCQNSY